MSIRPIPSYYFAREIAPIENAIAADHTFEIRERFTYISMLHSAAYHHRKAALEKGIRVPEYYEAAVSAIEIAMIELADTIGVEHRFLSAFYLFYNPEIPDLNGTFAQFRPTDYETAFLRINREGTLQYKQGAQALSQAHELLSNPLPSLASVKSLLDVAAACFKKISLGNAMLLKTPGGEEFGFLTQYFGEVRVAGGSPLRGVNAGDQPWGYMIDLLLGVDLRSVFVRSFEGTVAERQYLAGTHSNTDVVAHEFAAGGYLHANYLLPEDYIELERVIESLNHTHETLLAAIQKQFPPSEQVELAGALLAAVKHYLAASNVHYQLARRYVPRTSAGEQIGSAGTNIVKYLKEGLNAEREKMKHDLESRYPELVAIHQSESTIA